MMPKVKAPDYAKTNRRHRGGVSATGLPPVRFRIDENLGVPIDIERSFTPACDAVGGDTSRRPEMPISISMIVLSSQLVMPVADGVPKFDIARNCKLDVAATAGLSVDQSVKSCMNDERKAKQQLAGQRSKFPAPSRTSCASQESIGGTPSYVGLQTCLQLGQWAR